MFDDLMKELEKLEGGYEVAFPVHPDEDGYVDKECPSESCMFQFKIHNEDWAEKVSDEEVYCALCGHTAPADSWWTTEQLENAQEQAFQQFSGIVGDAMRRDARRFNRAQSEGGFLRMSMEVNGTRGRRALVPIPSGEPLDLRIECDTCATRFAVVGSAFFCPACGASSATRVFDDSIRKVRLKAEASDALRNHYAGLGERDEGEILARTLLETALTDCVVAYQRLAEELYRSHPNGSDPRLNVFQRIRDGSELWRSVVGEGYEDWLSEDELTQLNVFFQRRHLLQHTDGSVDERYLERSGDHTYQVGQRIVVRQEDVIRLADLVERLAAELRTRF